MNSLPVECDELDLPSGASQFPLAEPPCQFTSVRLTEILQVLNDAFDRMTPADPMRASEACS